MSGSGAPDFGRAPALLLPFLPVPCRTCYNAADTSVSRFHLPRASLPPALPQGKGSHYASHFSGRSLHPG
jgi:hypothetical protein